MFTLEFIALSPLLSVVVGTLIVRFAVQKRPFAALGWSIFSALTVGSFFLPLAIGIWIPDFLGTTHTLATATSPSTGYTFRVTQQWNYVDFYTTTLYITTPDGRSADPILDGDDNKSWNVPIAVDETKRTVTVTLSGGRSKVLPW